MKEPENFAENFYKKSVKFANYWSEILRKNFFRNSKSYRRTLGAIKKFNLSRGGAKEQANNTRSTVFLTYNGETKSASEWAEITGIRQGTIVRRKTSYGWSDEECLTIKVGEKRV